MRKILVVSLITIVSVIFVQPVFATVTHIGLESDGPITYGSYDRIGGWLFTGSRYNGSNGINGKPVSIYFHYPGQRWRFLQTTTTQTLDVGKGLIIGTLRPSKKIYYKARFFGDGTYDASDSAIVKTFVRVKITANGKKYTGYYRISGTVRPSKAKRLIAIYVRKKGGNWAKVKTLRLSSHSTYAYRYRYRSKGIYYIKAFYHSDKYNSANYSSLKKFTVF